MMSNTILKDDVDNFHDSSEVSAKVALEELQAQAPKPFYLTSQFFTMAATWVAGSVVMILLSKGLLTESTAVGFQEGLTAIILALIGWVTQKYISGRNEVTAIKQQSMARIAEARAMAEVRASSLGSVGGVVAPARLESFDLAGFFNNLGSVKTAISVGLLMLGNASDGKKAKAAVALKAALAALNEIDGD